MTATAEKDVLYTLMGAVFIVGILYFIWGNSKFPPKKMKVVKITSLIIVSSYILYAIGLNYYYQRKIKQQNIDYQILLNRYKYDSVGYYSITNRNKTKVIDSLQNYINKLKNIISQIKKYQSVVGPDGNKKVIDSASATLTAANSDIKLFKEYNETLNIKLNVKDILTNEKGYTLSDSAPEFQFNCPTDQTSEYVDLKIKFNDDNIVNKIACLYVVVAKDTAADKRKQYTYIFEQAYKAQPGNNVIRILNYTKQPDILLNVGYILKKDSQDEFPNFEKVTCKYNITNPMRLQASN